MSSATPQEESPLHPAWKEEIKRRSAQLDADAVTPVVWDEVKRRAWEAVEQDRANRNG
jgi:putative addiction module component (TIGR02574 family)